jgi:hypothetical protein
MNTKARRSFTLPDEIQQELEAIDNSLGTKNLSATLRICIHDKFKQISSQS